MSGAILLEPHPDDAVLFSCWNLLRYRPKVITVLRPDRMAQASYPGGPACTVEQRMKEHEDAMEVLGVDWEWWDYSDVKPDWYAIQQRISALEREQRGMIWFTPAAEYDGHSDHTSVSHATISGDGPLNVTQYLTYTRGKGRSTEGRQVDFEPHWPALKLRALACYESQIAHPATSPWFIDTGLREYVL